MHFFRLIIAIGAMFLIMPYMYYNSIFTDEFERENKFKAHKFSWVFTMLSVILLYIICKKTSLQAEFALELILWIGFISYFLAFKFLSTGLDATISENLKKKITFAAIFITMFIFGLNMGFTIPDLNSEQINENKLVFYGVSLFILLISVVFLTKFAFVIVGKLTIVVVIAETNFALPSLTSML